MRVRIRFCIEALWESEKQRPRKVLERPGNSDLGAQMYEKLNAASKRWRPLFLPLVVIACAKCNLVGSERVITLPSISKMAVHRDFQSCEEFLRQTRDWMQTLTIEDLLEGEVGFSSCSCLSLQQEIIWHGVELQLKQRRSAKRSMLCIRVYPRFVPARWCELSFSL